MFTVRADLYHTGDVHPYHERLPPTAAVFQTANRHRAVTGEVRILKTPAIYAMTQSPEATPAGEFFPDPPVVGAAGPLSGLTWWSAGLIAFGFAPVLIEFFSNICRLSHYEFFPSALAAGGLLAWSRLKEVPRPLNAGQPWVTLPILLFSFAVLALAILLWSPWLGTIAALVCLAGVIWWLGGWELLKRMIPALIMIMVIIPPPFGLDNTLTFFLRGIATTASSRVLDLLGVVHCVSGNVIELPRKKLLVEEACSGINSVLFITAVMIFYLLWRRRSFWCYLICLPAAIGFVLMGNVVRITLCTWLQFHNGMDLLSGWKHETLGLILAAIYIGLVMSLEHLLRPRAVGEKDPGKENPPAGTPSVSPAARRRISPAWGWVAGILFGIMGLAGAARCYAYHQDKKSIFRASGPSALRQGATFDLPKQIGTWTRATSGEPTLKKLETIGLSSMLWQFTSPSQTKVAVAFDYPIWGYHDVTACYIGNGWDISRRERIAKDDKSPPWLEMNMRKDTEGHGALWVATINERGQWMEVAQVKRSFRDRLKSLGTIGGSEETSYRVQLLAISAIPLTADERESCTRLFLESRSLLARQLLGQIPAQTKAAP
ncbi:MAG: exosortase U [Verrucomicrobiae bacterium]